jgi:tetratricopeptide (TPR) repeat protein
VNNYLIVALVGLFYILVVGGMALLRREGLSNRFALEALAIIAVALLTGRFTGVLIDPILLFILLYLVTMRARVLTDLANFLFKRRGYGAAEPVYRFALRLFPDETGRFVVLINWGIARFMAGDVQGAIATLNNILELATLHGGLGSKYEAACRYNLGIAYRQADDHVNAVLQLNAVVDRFPDTIYGRAAEHALEKQRKPNPQGRRT